MDCTTNISLMIGGQYMHDDFWCYSMSLLINAYNFVLTAGIRTIIMNELLIMEVHSVSVNSDSLSLCMHSFFTDVNVKSRVNILIYLTSEAVIIKFIRLCFL